MVLGPHCVDFCAFADDTMFHYLVKVVSARFLHSKINIYDCT